MSFFSNLVSKARNLASPNSEAKHEDAEVEGGWDLVSAEEATGYYTDRVTLFLGPHLETRLHILLADIPQTSVLLNYIASPESAHHYMHLTTLEVPMVTSYLEMVGASLGSLVRDASWADLFTLAITSEVLQDSVVEGKAIAALKLNSASTPSLSHGDIAIAREYQLKTGAGERLIHALEERAGRDASPEGAKYKKSVLKNKILAGVKKAGEGDGKVYPSRQPTTPPSVDALRSGTVGGFVWPQGSQGTAEK
jgi:hypothetical protein